MDLLSKENIIFSEGLSSKAEVLSEIVKKAESLGVTDDGNELLKSFMEREKLGETGLGEGLAMPHAKSSCVNKASVIILKSLNSIEWESFDDSGANLIIALMVPENNADNVHLKIISALSRKLVNEEFKSRLFNSKTADDIESLFQEIEIHK